MRNSKTSGMIKTVVAAAGLAMAMPAMAQFEGFSEIQSQVTGVAGVLQDLEGGDITGDGLNDMVFINETGSVWYFAGFDDGLFDDPPVRVVEPDDAGRAIELVDYDNDGDLDIVRVAAINAGDFRAYKNDGSGNFEFDFAITGIGNVNTRSGLEFGDFDGDGDRDLFVLVEDGVVIIENIGDFDADNRAGMERTLHRISAIRNRRNTVVGLTCRIGRAVYGTIDIIEDLITSGQSILMLGPPGVGKTTMLREAARVLAEQRRVVIVDTSNEIGGDGDIPHPAIGRARRMQVPRPSYQHETMIEAVENHNPEVIVIDEIGREREAAAVCLHGPHLLLSCDVEDSWRRLALR